MSTWSSLESLLFPATIPAVWQSLLDDSFPAFRNAFLLRTDTNAGFFPCPRHCGCAHEVVRLTPSEFLGICRCELWGCSDLKLSSEDITVWELSWNRLAQALCRALMLQPRPADLRLSTTRQIGAWSTNGVPVILTIQSTASRFREILTTLTARLHAPFILLAPTASHFDADCAGLLGNVGAGFFPLENTIHLTPSGSLQPATAPGELFARFTAAPAAPPSEEVARSAFALVQQLDSEWPLKPPTLLTVFRLYCVEELSAAQVARKCRSSKATVVRRLELLRSRIGQDPQDLRRLSSHFDKQDDTLYDSRAARIHRKSLIYDTPEAEE
jgi:hypothetical protein